MTQTIFTRERAKIRAKTLRAEALANGRTMSHSQALEQVAKENGFADWNVMSARLRNRPEISFAIGDRVAGDYLKQAFAGRVTSVREMAGGSAFEIEIDFDEPVDVVSFSSFSAWRKRVRATISAQGVSFAKTGDGLPQMVIEHIENMIV